MTRGVLWRGSESAPGVAVHDTVWVARKGVEVLWFLGEEGCECRWLYGGECQRSGELGVDVDGRGRVDVVEVVEVEAVVDGRVHGFATRKLASAVVTVVNLDGA